MACIEATVRRSSCSQRDLQPDTGVVRRPPHLRAAPVFAEIRNALFLVCLEPTAREHDRARTELSPLMPVAGNHASDRAVLDEEVGDIALEKNRSACSGDRRHLRIDEARALARRSERQSTPEHMSTVDDVSLSIPDRVDGDDVAREPTQGVE